MKYSSSKELKIVPKYEQQVANEIAEDFDLSLRKFLYPNWQNNNNLPDWYNSYNIDYPYNKTIYWFFKLCGESDDKIASIYILVRSMMQLYKETTVNVLYGLSDHSKKYGFNYNGYEDNIFVDLHLLIGYCNPDRVDKTNLVRNWITKEAKRDHTQVLPRHMMKEKLKEFFLLFSTKDYDRSKYNTFVEDFINNVEKWTTSGGGGGKNTIITSAGEFTTRSKVAKILSMSKDEIKSILINNVPFVAKAFVKKKETTLKKRVIISTDIESFIKMSFLNYILQSFITEHPNTDMFDNGVRSEDRWKVFLDNNSKAQPLTMDQSDFDHYISKNDVIMFLDEMCSYIKQRYPDESEVINIVLNTIKYGLDNLTVDGFKYEHGLLSGWRITALAGTAINFSQMRTVADLFENKYNIKPLIFKESYRGDDVIAWVKNKEIATKFVELAMYYKLPVHPTKTMIRKFYGEYLRISFNQFKTFRYPARLLHAILFINPESMTRDKVDNTNSLIKNIIKMQNRFSCVNLEVIENILEKFLQPIKFIKGFSTEIYRKFMYTPSAFGGLGLSIDTKNNHNWYKLEKKANRARVFSSSIGNYFPRSTDNVLSIIDTVFNPHIRYRYYLKKIESNKYDEQVINLVTLHLKTFDIQEFAAMRPFFVNCYNGNHDFSELLLAKNRYTIKELYNMQDLLDVLSLHRYNKFANNIRTKIVFGRDPTSSTQLEDINYMSSLLTDRLWHFVITLFTKFDTKMIMNCNLAISIAIKDIKSVYLP